ncbi:MAG: membrane protein of unknown function DUF1467 [Saliniramus fredricksonii]|uniref:Predicted secreted protein n=1 Tax=Saliniramus fredricksonii TaxID=1653334 RepID=A0A0P8AB39_9HYPH|nr:DUF1467 family protein [Saliniramus fredricksonii]KPQ12435.1 MAG: membrane protein of unknown function DUF1467 [Saliniramus fredricksonii]SCC81337.1 Predicted secreted protein [Saliniramus fredricksonii]
MVNAIRLIATSTSATLIMIGAITIAALIVGIGVLDMGITGALALYFVVWWIMLFAVLPFGVRSQLESGEVVAGSEPGAPAAPALRQKAIWTTIVSALVFNLTILLLPLAGL